MESALTNLFPGSPFPDRWCATGPGSSTDWRRNTTISTSQELPSGADTDQLLRGSNLIKFQVNATPANIVSGGLLFNAYHSPYDGISSLVPQQSTTDRNTIAWLPYLRDQQSFHNGRIAGLRSGRGALQRRLRAAWSTALSKSLRSFLEGSYFENLTSHSQRIEGNAALYLPPRHWAGEHDLKAGIDLDHIGFGETVTRVRGQLFARGWNPAAAERFSRDRAVHPP